MPIYDATAGLKPVDRAGYNALVWDAETPAVGSASMRIALNRDPNLPNCFSVEVAFVSAPGVFAVDVQVADTDVEKYYTTKTAGVINAVNAGFVGRVELVDVVAKFVRLKMTARANSVACTAKIV